MSLLAAFDVGQLLNQFVWGLGQAVVLPGHDEVLEQSLCKLAGRALEMTPTLQSGMRLQATAVECLNSTALRYTDKESEKL
jgi:hypothetical protein